MFYKHWKKIALALTAFFWGGCNNNSSGSEEPTKCSLTIGCPEYGVAMYFCENPEDYNSEDMDKKCTFTPAPKCEKTYSCEDGVYCWADEDETVLNCSDKQGKDFTINEKDFKTKYDTEGNR